ncbi:hypothetical protein UQ30_27315, partial [Escherichia coli]
ALWTVDTTALASDCHVWLADPGSQGVEAYRQSCGKWNKLPPTVSHIHPDFPEPYESPADGLRGKNEYF